MPELRQPPYPTVLKPYGQSLVALAKERDDIVCLTGDLSKQCEIDLFADAYPERFIHAGMAEANMMGVAGALARDGFVPFVHTFGTFATRRPLDQVINSIAFPNLRVRIMGFMPGVSSPGGPSHQAIDDVALMRAVPNMTVVDVADAVEVRQVANAIVDVDGPVYVRLKRGEIPVIFGDDHRLRLDRADVLDARRGRRAVRQRDDARPGAGRRAAARRPAARVSVANVPVIKPLDAATVTDVGGSAKVVVTAENHTVVGGLGSAVAEALARPGSAARCAASGCATRSPRARRTGPYLFGKYGLSTPGDRGRGWTALGRRDPAPVADGPGGGGGRVLARLAAF